jgi:hypothetical protein
MLEYCNVTVLRRNHVGDWGTQVWVNCNPFDWYFRCCRVSALKPVWALAMTHWSVKLMLNHSHDFSGIYLTWISSPGCWEVLPMMVAQVSPGLKCDWILDWSKDNCGWWQFGMLIEYLFEEFPDWEEIQEQAIGDLQVCLVWVD